MRTLAAALIVLALASCSRDPNVVKVRYLENGNKYFERGRYKEASIMYRNALKKDPLYGQAYYRLGLTELKQGRIPAAVANLRRALDGLKGKKDAEADYWDASVKLADVYLAVTKDKQFLDEAEQIGKELLKKDPNSFHGHRIAGDIAFMAAQKAYSAKDAQTGRELLDKAVAEYRRADAAKPGQTTVRLALARALSAARNFPEAESTYRSVIAQDKTATLAYTELYQLLRFFQKKNGEAEELLKTAVANNPRQPGLVTMLAAHYFDFQRRDEGVKVLDRMKANLKDFPRAYLLAGDFYARLGDFDQALREYDEGLRRDPVRDHQREYRRHSIEALMRQGKKAEAAEINQAILKDNPKDTDARGFAAALLVDRGEVARAIGELQGVVSADPKNVVARFFLGRAHMARGEIEQARGQFFEAIKHKPDYIPARLALAQLHVMRGEFDAAFQAAQEVLKFDPANHNARLIESAALMGQKRYGDSRRLLETMAAAQPSSPEVLLQMGVVNLAENKYKEAEEAFRKAYQLNPANSRGLIGVVETYMAQNRTAQALQILQGEAEKSPDRLDLRMALGNMALRAGRYDMAAAEYQALLQKVDIKSRAAGEIYARLGEASRRKGDVMGAVSAFQKAREIMPENAQVTSALAITLDGAGRKQEARTAYESAIRLQPANAVALNNLACIIAEYGGDLDQALTYAQRAKQYLPDYDEVTDTLGLIYLKKNLNDNAIKIFTELVAKKPRVSTFRYHLGMALSHKGDRAGALKELEEALKHKPQGEEAAKIRELIGKLS
jgi:tetratricopeptide (TPR) repeat protein